MSTSRRLTVVRAPLVPIALCVLTGTLLGRYGLLPWSLLLFLGCAGLLFGAAALKSGRLHSLAALSAGMSVLCFTAVYVHFACHGSAANHVAGYIEQSASLARVRGKIVSWPTTAEDDPDRTPGYQRPPRTCFLLQTSAIRTRSGWDPVEGLLRTTIKEPRPDLRAGMQVELIGWTGRYSPPDNPGSPDPAAIAANNGIYAWFSVPAADGVTILDGTDQGLVQRSYWHLRSLSRQHVADMGDRRSGRLLNALITGERHPALRRLNETMMQSGTAHYMSISGLHLGIFLGFIYGICRVCMLPPRRSALLVLGILTLYVLIAEPRPPLLRSALMAGALCVAVIARRRYAALNVLAGAMILLVLVDPRQLWQAGFQLSFAIVLGLLLLHRPMRVLLFGWTTRHRGLVVFRSDQRFGRWVHYRGRDLLIGSAVAGVNAYLVSLPLIAYHFGIFSPYGALLSMLLLPLVALTLIPGYLSLALAWPMPNLARHMGDGAAWMADRFASGIDALHWLPGLSVPLRPVPLWWIWLYYAALVAILLLRSRRRYRWLAAMAVVALVAASLWTQRRAQAPTDLNMHLLSVGPGQCLLLETPAGKTHLIDAGTRSGVNAYEFALQPFLVHTRLPEPESIVLSHANTDHYNAVPSLLSDSTPETIYTTHQFLNTEADSPPQRLISSCRKAGAGIRTLHAGQSIRLDAGTTAEVLWPAADAPADLSHNDASLVLKIRCNGRSILVAGDIGRRAQEALLEHPERLRADVLVLPHHGSWEPSLPAFVRAVGAGVVVASCGRRPVASPSDPADAQEFYDHLAADRVFRCTSDDGYIAVELKSTGIKVRSLR
ncbi:MAG: ComEC/Rec2 family competence protein [Phycisphaerae bacterium]